MTDEITISARQIMATLGITALMTLYGLAWWAYPGAPWNEDASGLELGCGLLQLLGMFLGAIGACITVVTLWEGNPTLRVRRRRRRVPRAVAIQPQQIDWDAVYGSCKLRRSGK